MAKNNLKQATKKARHESLVDTLFDDSVGLDEVQDFVQEFTTNSVEDVVGDFIDRVKDGINSVSPSMVVTGQIEDITMVTDDSDGSISVMGFPQTILQSRGTSGVKTKRDTQHEYTDKKPPLDPIIEWIKERGLNSVNNEFFGGEQDFAEVDINSDKEIRKIAFAIQNHIFNHGYPSKGDYWDSNVKILEDDLLNKVTDDITDILTYHITNQFGQSIHDKPKK